MGNFNRDGNRGDNKSSGGFNRGFGGGRQFGGGSGGGFGGEGRFGGRDTTRPMHKAVCDTCGAHFELPFRPKGDRPVFCNDCFGKKGDGGGGRPRTFSSERQGRPGADFFEKREKEAKNSREVMDQLKMLHLKIDNLVRLLTPHVLVEKTKKSETKEEEAVKESPKVKKEKTKKKAASKKA